MASLLVKQFDSLVLGVRQCSLKQVINQVQRWLAQHARENKRPATAFGLFLKDRQPQLKGENPHMKPVDIMKLASNLWKSESYVVQQKYRKEYELLRNAYREKIKVIPKRPSPPYILFYKEQSILLQQDYPSILDRAKHCGRLWQNLPDYEKSKYRAVYDERMKAYSKNITEEEKKLLKERRDAKKKRKRKVKQKV